MIFFGTKSTKTLSKSLPEFQCPSCNQIGLTEIHIYSSYFHLFLIPFITIKPKGHSVCSHCKTKFKPSEMSSLLKHAFSLAKQESRIPPWQFLGISITFIITSILVGLNLNQNTKKNYLASPQKGDVYSFYIGTNPKTYSTFIISNCSKDSLWIKNNKKSTSNIEHLKVINSIENYSNSEIGISKEEIEALYKKGEIFNIDR